MVAVQSFDSLADSLAVLFESVGHGAKKDDFYGAAAHLAFSIPRVAKASIRHPKPILLMMIAALGPLLADGTTPDEYKARRAELRKSLDGVMLLFAANKPEDLHVSFFQDTNFLYLSGWREPSAAMMLTKNEEFLFSAGAQSAAGDFYRSQTGCRRCRCSAADGIRQGCSEACDRGDVLRISVVQCGR